MMLRFTHQGLAAFRSSILSTAAFLLCFLPVTTSATEAVCAAFNDNQVEPGLVEHMRNAAGKGKLYRIQPEESQIRFEIDSPIGIVQAHFKNFQGGFTLEAGGTEGKALLTARTDSVDTSSGFIRSLLTSETFLDTERYPHLLFVSRDFFWVNAREAVLIGDLTLHGMTRRIGLHVQLLAKDAADAPGTGRLLVEASARIHRSAFGMNALTAYVDDKVTLYMKIHAKKYDPAMAAAQNELDDSMLFLPTPPGSATAVIAQ